MDRDYILDTIRLCMSKCCSGKRNVVLRIMDCRSITRFRHELERRGGVYVFVDPTTYTVYYVGESGDLFRRIYGEHCRANIGGSEAVVRFLMYILDEICRDERIRRIHSVLEREDLVKEMLREFIGRFEIYIAFCINISSIDKLVRKEIEDCLKNRLKPRLN